MIVVSHVGSLFGKVTELTNAVEDERDEDVNDGDENRGAAVDNGRGCVESGEDDNEDRSNVFDVRDGGSGDD